MATIKNGTEVTFTNRGQKMTGILKGKPAPTGTGRGHYPRAIVEVDGRQIKVPLASLEAKQ
jgi:hypothetical protein